MTADVVARAILMAGDALTESDLPVAMREYLSLLAIGPSMALRSPLGLLEFVMTGPTDWYPRYRAARRAFAASAAGNDERVVQIRTHLTKARNWSVVVLGSVLIFVGASTELAHTLVTGRPQ